MLIGVSVGTSKLKCIQKRYCYFAEYRTKNIGEAKLREGKNERINDNTSHFALVPRSPETHDL